MAVAGGQSLEAEIINRAGDVADKYLEGRGGPSEIAEKIVDKLEAGWLFGLTALVVVCYLFYKCLPHYLSYLHQNLALRREWDHKDKQLQVKLDQAEARKKRRSERAEMRRKEQ